MHICCNRPCQRIEILKEDLNQLIGENGAIDKIDISCSDSLIISIFYNDKFIDPNLSQLQTSYIISKLGEKTEDYKTIEVRLFGKSSKDKARSVLNQQFISQSINLYRGSNSLSKVVEHTFDKIGPIEGYLYSIEMNKAHSAFNLDTLPHFANYIVLYSKYLDGDERCKYLRCIMEITSAVLRDSIYDISADNLDTLLIMSGQRDVELKEPAASVRYLEEFAAKM